MMKEIFKKITDFFTAIWLFIMRAGIYKGWPILIAIPVHLIFFGWSPVSMAFYVGFGSALAWVQFREEILSWWKKP